MFSETPGQGALVAFLVLLPAAVRLWTSRTLARATDAAVLGERLLATQKVNSGVLAASIAVMLVFTAGWWALPLMFLAYVAAAYPLRRALYEETWSLWQYLSFTGRLLLATAGFWIVLVAIPAVVASAGRRDWLVALALAAVMVAWQAYQGPILRKLMRTQPLRDPVLRSRFQQLADRAGIPAPQFEQVDLRGGVIANAVALASTRGSAVVFTDTLLARLEPDESAAICAHELAHLEHFSPARLRRIAIVTCSLIVIGVSLPILARFAALPTTVVWVCWLGIFVAALVWFARDRQKNETRSDLRAVEITGDGEALVRALTKGYAISRMPRRLHPEFERQATHPSLARRIRDIRRAAGVAPSAVAAGLSVAGTDAATTVTFGPDHLNWKEGDAALHSLSYSHLSELRVNVNRTGAATLVAVERTGRRWEVPLLEADVARVQSALDLVDGRLAETGAKPSQWPVAARVIAALLAAATLALTSFAAAMVTVLAFAQSSPAMFGAAGAAGVVSAVLALRDQGFGGDAMKMSFGLLAATLGTMLLIAATALRASDAAASVRPRRKPGLWLALLAILGLLSFALVALQSSNAVRLHLWARALEMAAVLPVACAAAFVYLRPRGWRAGAAIAGIAGFLVIAAGSTTFLDAFGRDAFLLPADVMPVKTLREHAAEFPLDGLAFGLRLSPTARHLAVTPSGYDEEVETGSFLVGSFGGTLEEIPASDLVFVDDERLLTIEPTRGGVQVRLLRASAPSVAIWERFEPRMIAAQVAVEPRAGQWQVMGFDAKRRLVRVEGPLDGEVTRRVETDRQSMAVYAVAAWGDRMVGVEMSYGSAVPYSATLWPMAAWLPLSDAKSRIWAASGSTFRNLGESRFEARCLGDRRGDAQLTCVSFEGTRSRVLLVDAHTQRISASGLLRGRFFSGTRASDGWLGGWFEGRFISLNARKRQVVTVAPSSDDFVVLELVGSDRVMAAVLHDGTRSRIRLYALGD